MAYGEIARYGIVAADGTLSISISPGARTRGWTVQQISVDMPAAPIGAVCKVTKSGFLVTYVIATGDTAGGDPPVRLQGTETLTVSWTGCTPGAAGAIFAIYDDGL
jgi:hypothetical protein